MAYELTSSRNEPGVVNVYDVGSCLLLNQLLPGIIPKNILVNQKYRILTQAVRIRETDKKGNFRCKYYYGSIRTRDQLFSALGVMQVFNDNLAVISKEKLFLKKLTSLE